MHNSLSTAHSSMIDKTRERSDGGGNTMKQYGECSIGKLVKGTGPEIVQL